jgi:hypothetical protein
MDTALPPGMKGWEMDERALQDRTASMCQSGVATQPLEERRARNECYDIRLGHCKARVPDVLGRRANAYLEPLVRQAEFDARNRTDGVCKLVGETHAQCVRERGDESRRIEEARKAVRDGFRAKTRITPP